MEKLKFEDIKNHFFKELKISKNENLSFEYSLDDVFVKNKYGLEFDFDIYLPSKGFNLQRPYVWNELQQREFIMSLLTGRNIPPLVFVIFEHKKYLVIDGKQRLMTLKRFLNNEFPIIFKGKEYYYNSLDDMCKYQINSRCSLTYTAYYSYEDEKLTDNQLIQLFNFYNFAGTPQEKEHEEKLKKALLCE